jgi:hypothetical protein
MMFKYPSNSYKMRSNCSAGLHCVGIHVALFYSRGLIHVVVMATTLNFEVLCHVNIIQYKHTKCILGYKLKYRNSSVYGG